MKKVFAVVKVLFGLIALACLAGAVYFGVTLDEPTEKWVTVASLVGIAAITGFMAVRDLVLWLRSRGSS